MSVTNISDRNKNLLWAISAGRCQYRGCDKVLYQDILTKTRYNAAYIAHIVADSPNGPRGHHTRSYELKDKIENLMLLCDSHHNLIDEADIANHPEEVLLLMKTEHEERIKIVASIDRNMGSHIVIYRANVGEHSPQISYDIAKNEILPNYYPEIDSAIELGLSNSPFKDRNLEFWEIEEKTLSQNFNEHLSPQLKQNKIKHISLFALAPIPLLIKLGTLLNDIYNINIHQPVREPKGWSLSDSSVDENFIINFPEKRSSKIALNISLSANISNERITQIVRGDCDIVTLTISNPTIDFLKHKSQLAQFRIKMREVFKLIDDKYSHPESIKIFPAMPVATAIEVGRVWMPKSNPKLLVYDQNAALGGFSLALSIG